jgi:hypothetical protein
LYNRFVLKSAAAFILVMASMALAQQEPGSLAPQEDQPKIKLNYLNVCTPSAEEQAALKNALAKVSGSPAFAPDFEISRGQSTLRDGPPSKFVRLRRDFSSQMPMMTAQYSMSIDEKAMTELLVLRMRDPKEFLELTIEDRVSTAAASPVAVVTADTPASRIRIERLGKSSVVLARCEAADQSAYEPLFKEGSDLIARYRAALGLRKAFRTDIAWLSGNAKPETPVGSQKQP